MAKLVARATVLYERSSGDRMMPEVYDQRLGVPKGDSPTCLLTMFKGEGRRSSSDVCEGSEKPLGGSVKWVNYGSPDGTRF